MKDTILFIPCVLFEFAQQQSFFDNTSFYLLRSYLNQFPELQDRFDIRILPYQPPSTLPMSLGDRNYEKTLNEILRARPRVVAFSLYAWSIEPCHRLAAVLQGMNPELLIVAGGPEVAERDALTREYPAFDVLIEGDGELPLKRMLDRLATGSADFEEIPNLSYRTADGFVHNQSAAEMEPADAIPNFYRDYPEKLAGPAFYLTTRGCSRSCKYCLWAKQGLSKKSPDKILRELETIVGSRQVPLVVLFDYDLLEIYDNDLDTLQELIDLFGRWPEIAVQFFVNPQNLVHPAVRKIVDELNVNKIHIGVQSMNAETLHNVNRGWAVQSLPLLEQVDEELRQYGVVELVYPLPGETLESFVSGLEQLIGWGYFRFQIFPLMILRGTALHRGASKLGISYLHKPPYYAYETPTFSREDWLDAGALSYVLSRAAEILGHAAHEWRPFSDFMTQNPGTIRQLLERIRRGVEVNTLLTDLMEDAIGEEWARRRLSNCLAGDMS